MDGVGTSESGDDALGRKRRLHPSKYQQDHTDHGHDSQRTLTDSGLSESGRRSHRIGAIPDHQQLELSPLLHIDPDDNRNEDADYFDCDGTPMAVREGTETVQKTLRAVWVRGHTRIGTVIQIFLIIVNLLAAVMFVAAIEGHEFENVEFALVSVFLVDFSIRMYAAKSTLRYLFSFKGMLDFVSVVPGILLAVFESVATLHHFERWNPDIPLWTFSFARAMRVLRILKMLKHIVKKEDVGGFAFHSTSFWYSFETLKWCHVQQLVSQLVGSLV